MVIRSHGYMRIATKGSLTPPPSPPPSSCRYNVSRFKILELSATSKTDKKEEEEEESEKKGEDCFRGRRFARAEGKECRAKWRPVII